MYVQEVLQQHGVRLQVPLLERLPPVPGEADPHQNPRQQQAEPCAAADLQACVAGQRGQLGVNKEVSGLGQDPASMPRTAELAKMCSRRGLAAPVMHSQAS